MRRVEDPSEGGRSDRGHGLDTPDTRRFPHGPRGAGTWAGPARSAAHLRERRAACQLGGGSPPAKLRLGFCVYNDVAIAIRHLTRQGLWVLYVDVDVHHEDGVQQILDDDRRVMTISLHESRKFLFPGTGGPRARLEWAGGSS